MKLKLFSMIALSAIFLAACAWPRHPFHKGDSACFPAYPDSNPECPCYHAYRLDGKPGHP